MNARLLALAVLLFSAGCKEPAWSGHGVSWKPPRGVAFEAESTAEGATAAVKFSGGVALSLYAAGGMPSHEALEEVAARFLPKGVKAISRRVGSLPAGKVARLVWADQGNRTLLYYLPSGDRVLVVTLTAPEARFNGLETQFDLSLATLRL